MTLAHPIGVPSHLSRGSPHEVAAACRDLGLTCVQLSPGFPGLAFHQPGDVTPDRCRRAAGPFLECGLAVAAVDSSTALLDPDLRRRHRGLLRLSALLGHARDYGTRYVLADSGSLCPHSPCEPWPGNASPRAREELRLIAGGLVRRAADCGVTLLLRPARAHVLAGADDALRLRAELDSPHLGFVLDPAEALADRPAEDWPRLLDDLLTRLGPHAPLAHVKDLHFGDAGPSLPPVGQGVLHYGRLLQRWQRHQPRAALILAHLRPADVPAARDALLRFLAYP